MGLLAKLHQGVVELLEEAAGALHTATMECKDLSSRFVVCAHLNFGRKIDNVSP